MTKKRVIHLIQNCRRAKRTCTSDWGKAYWSDVESQLRIKYKNLL